MTISDAQHRLLLDNLTTATLLLNAELRLEYMNPAAEMLLAVSGQRSHGQFISELFTESPEALNALHQAVVQAHPFTKREARLRVGEGERQMLFDQLDRLRRGDVLVLDRGYPASWLVQALLQRSFQLHVSG